MKKWLFLLLSVLLVSPMSKLHAQVVHDTVQDQRQPKSHFVNDNHWGYLNIISTNAADLILQKWNLSYEHIAVNSRWRTKTNLFVDVKDKNYGVGLAGYSNWKISKHVEHYIGGQFLGEWIDSFYEDLYLKYRPRGFSIAPRFSTGVAFTVWKRLSLGIEGNIGPGFVFREQRFKGVYLSVGLGVNVGVKF